MNSVMENIPEKAKDRLEIIERIKEYEKDGKFDIDVEDDPPTRPLEKGECDYKYKKLSSKIGSFFANIAATNFFEKLIKNNQLIIKEIVGIENFKKVEGGAFLTCNHFNPYDNYAVYRSIKPHLKGRLYKVIREGNYTSFPGLYGYFFRHCNTLPLAENYEVMKEFLSGVKYHLEKGRKILIYPEQAMWWNYKKPRPLKDGAFSMAVKNKVPVIPFFITMTDSEFYAPDGFKVPEYHIFISEPIYPDESLSAKQNAAAMKEKNFAVWKDIYEKFYGIKLSYTE